MSQLQTEVDILSKALGVPARQVLVHAESNGQRHGWRDGYLSSAHGACAPDHRIPTAQLRKSLGYVWIRHHQRLSALQERCLVRATICAMPVISGTSDTISDGALWAASAYLMYLASAFRQEERLEGTSAELSLDAEIGLPKSISVPLKQICLRLGRSEPRLSYYELTLLNIDEQPHCWMRQINTKFTNGVELITRCLETTVSKDNYTLTKILLELRRLLQDLTSILRCVSAEDFVASRLTEFGVNQSLSSAASELGLPVFQILHTFMHGQRISSEMHQQVLTERQFLPVNVRAFVAALDATPIHHYMEESGDRQLSYAWKALEEAYFGSSGVMGMYLQKRTAAQDLITKTRPHIDTISDFPNATVTVKPDFEYCTIPAKITSRCPIDADPDRRSALVALSVQPPHGLAFDAGDRLLVMPLNPWVEVEKIAAALGLEGSLDVQIPLYGDMTWNRFSRQLHPRTNLQSSILTVEDVLRYGDISPLSKHHISTLDKMFYGTCPTITELLKSQTWPLTASLGDLLQVAIEEVSPVVWDAVFDLSHLSWLPEMIPVASPRPYGISAPGLMGSSLASTVRITVTRVAYEVHPSLDDGSGSRARYGMVSSALNPVPDETDDTDEVGCFPVMIGVAPFTSFRLQSSAQTDVVMIAETSSIGTFRSLWRSRSCDVAETALFYAAYDHTRFAYEDELRRMQRTGQLKLFPVIGGGIRGHDTHQLMSSAILDQGQLVLDLLLGTAQGGKAGHVYISGTMALFASLISGLRRALYNADHIISASSAESLLEAAAIEGRLVLDIYSNPRQLLKPARSIKSTELASYSGHRIGRKLWIAILDKVYDFTNIMPLRTYDKAAFRLNAGTDASTSMMRLIVSSPELSNLLPGCHIGSLVPSTKAAQELEPLLDCWRTYLQSVTRSLTALAYEMDCFLDGDKIELSPGRARAPLRHYIQSQKRIYRHGVSTVFGIQLQELHMRTAFAYVNKSRPDTPVPDVMAIIGRARASPAATLAAAELQNVDMLSRRNQVTKLQAETIGQYVQAVAESEVHLLESIRSEACTAVELLETKMPDASDQSIASRAAALLHVLERVAYRYQAFWERTALESVVKSDLSKTKLRLKYDMINQPLLSGRTMVLPRPSPSHGLSMVGTISANFARLVDLAMQTVNEEALMSAYASKRGVSSSVRANTAFYHDEHTNALKTLTQFLGTSESAVKRLSQLPSDLSFAYIMATYGKGASGGSNHVRSVSAAKTVLRTLESQAGHETPRPRLIRRRTHNSSISSTVAQSIFSSPEAGTPETRPSLASSPSMPLQLTLRNRDRSMSRGDKHVQLAGSAAPSSRASRPGPPPSRSLSVAFAASSLSPMINESAADSNPDASSNARTLLPSPLLPEPMFTMGMKIASTPERTLAGLNTPQNPPQKRIVRNIFSHSRSELPATDRLSLPGSIAAPAVIVDQQESVEAAILSAQESHRAASVVKFGVPSRSRAVDQVYTFSVNERTSLTPLSAPVKRVVPNLYTHSSSERPRKRPCSPEYERLNLPNSSEDVAKIATWTEAARIQCETMSTVKFGVPKQFPVIDQVYTFSKEATCTNKPAKAVSKRMVATIYTHSNAERSGKFRASPAPTTKNYRSSGSTSKQVTAWTDAALASHVAASEVQFGVPKRNRAIDRVYSFSRQFQKGSTATDPWNMTAFAHPSLGLWAAPGSVVKVDAPAPGSQTLGHVGMWMRPVSRIINVDFERVMCGAARSSRPNPAKTPPTTTGLTDTKQWLWSEEGDEMPPISTTAGQVGMWMQPPSRKNNEDFECVKRGDGIINLELPTSEFSRQVSVFVNRQILMPQSPLLWTARIDEVPIGQKTDGYVGLWMRPASRIQNTDFHKLDRQARAIEPVSRRKVTVETKVAFGLEASLWSDPRDNSQESRKGTTSGCVGMWMWPPSQKVNCDFEQCIVNTTNYMLGSQSTMLRRMAQDMSSAAIETVPGMWSLVDWSNPKFETHARSIAVLRTAHQSTVQPQRRQDLTSHRKTTLGQVGMWMYPCSLKQNIDFEGHRAATDAAPEIAGSGDRPRGAELSLRMTSRQSAYGGPIGFTHGAVGLWMNPRSKKTNMDFEACLKAVEKKSNAAQDLTLSSELNGEEIPAHVDAQESDHTMSFLLESPTFNDTAHATMTPGSASTTDGLVRHTIDFTERLKKLNLELNMSDDDSDASDDDGEASNTPKILAFPPPRSMGQIGNVASAQVVQAFKPALAITTDAPKPETGLELLSSKRYTPDSASSADSLTMLSPASAAARFHKPITRSPSRAPVADASLHANIGPAPTTLPPTPPGVGRTQSLSVRNAETGREGRSPPVSRVNSVKNMWERRASLLGDTGRPSSRTPTPPAIAPLRLHRTRTESDALTATGDRRWMGAAEGGATRDRLVEPSYVYQDTLTSPLSPPVRAY
jgi:hypothetical protein